MLRNIPEEQTPHLHCGRNLNACKDDENLRILEGGQCYFCGSNKRGKGKSTTRDLIQQEKAMVLHKEFTERESDFTTSTGQADSLGGDITEEAQCL